MTNEIEKIDEAIQNLEIAKCIVKGKYIQDPQPFVDKAIIILKRF